MAQLVKNLPAMRETWFQSLGWEDPLEKGKTQKDVRHFKPGSLEYLMRSADSLEKTLMLGKIEGGRRRGRQRTRWLDGITN